MINNRYILGERLFGGAKSGELFHARDTLAIQNEMRPQVLIHFISSSEMGYSEYRRVSDELKHSQEITSENRSILRVLDAGWTGEKGYFVLESPEAWSVNVLPEVSTSPTSLHRRADSLVKKLQKQQLVNTGLKPSFFLVASNGELYLLGTALNGFVQNLQPDSDLLSGLIAQNRSKTNTGVLKWMGWSLLAFGSASLAGGVYINREMISSRLPLVFSDEVKSGSVSLADESVALVSEEQVSQNKSETMITLADQQVSPVISASSVPVEPIQQKPEKIVVSSVVQETGFLVDDNSSAIVPSGESSEIVLTIPSETIIAPATGDPIVSKHNLETEIVADVALTAETPDGVPAASGDAQPGSKLVVETIPELHPANGNVLQSDSRSVEIVNPPVLSEIPATDFDPENRESSEVSGDAEIVVDATTNSDPVLQEIQGASDSPIVAGAITTNSDPVPQATQGASDSSEEVEEPVIAVSDSNSDSDDAKSVIKLAQVSRQTIGPEADDLPVAEVAAPEEMSASVENDLSSALKKPEKPKSVRSSVSWNGMPEQKVLQRAEKAIQGGRLRSALYYLRALWRKGVKDGELLVMIQKIATDHHQQAKASLAKGDSGDAKLALKQAARLIREFGLTDLAEVQKQLEKELAVR